MSGSIYDRLKKKLEVQKYEEGISALDLASLPAPLRKIMRTMLREVEMTHVAIHQSIDETPPAENWGHADLDQALNELVKQNWLIRRGEGDRVNYTVNLRRKAGSSLDKNFWSALDAKISENKTEFKPPQ
jgi:predicted transcriptional regulator